MKKVNWHSIAPIFADVVISPWNLLVGGLLIKYLSTPVAVLSIIISIGLIKYFPSVLFSLISPIILFKLYYYLKNKYG